MQGTGPWKGTGSRLSVVVLAAVIVGAIAWMWFGLRGGSAAEPSPEPRGARAAEETTALGRPELRPFEASTDTPPSRGPSEREAAGSPQTTGIAVTVRHEDGSGASFVKVNAVARSLERTRCDNRGRAFLRVEPGIYEVFVPTPGGGDAMPLYPPEGLSSAEAIVTAENVTEVELTVYGGAVLHLQFVDAAGRNQDVGGLRTYVFGAESWVEPSDWGGRPSGSYEIDGLEAGIYGIVPNDRSRYWFEPRWVEVLLKEEKSITLTCREWREVKLDVRVRARPDGPILPFQVTANTTTLGTSTIPLPRRFAYSRGSVLSLNEIAIRLYPGRFRLALSLPATVGAHSQIVDGSAWQWDVEVYTKEVPEWPPFECLLESVGEIAIVTGRIVGSREREETRFQVQYHRPGVGDRRVALRPDREDESFRLVIDLALVEGDVIELLEFVGTTRTLVESLRLSPGEQEWSIVL